MRIVKNTQNCIVSMLQTQQGINERRSSLTVCKLQFKNQKNKQNERHNNSD